MARAGVPQTRPTRGMTGRCYRGMEYQSMIKE
jgi:hypothetical protein